MKRSSRWSLALSLLLTLPVTVRAADRLVLLGTAGGPTPKRTRAAPAQAVVIDGTVYVVDAGNGVGRQMALAGIPFAGLRHVFVTHHHSDHVADLVALPLLAWAADLDRPVTLHGPKPLAKSVRSGLRSHAFDIATRTVDEGRRPLRDLVRVHEIHGDGVVLEDERVRVSAARVDHPPIREAYAYRFDTASASVVISGDTAPSEALVRLARGADILVHEVLLVSADEASAWLGKPADDPLVRHVLRSHTSTTEVGKIARDAGVSTLVLSHFVPGDATVDREKVSSAIRQSFDGELIFGEDLMEIPLSTPGRR